MVEKSLNPLNIIFKIGGFQITDFAQTPDSITVSTEQSADLLAGLNNVASTFTVNPLRTLQFTLFGTSSQNTLLDALVTAQGAQFIPAALGDFGINSISNLPITVQYKSSNEYEINSVQWVITKTPDSTLPTAVTNSFIRTWEIRLVRQVNDIIGAAGSPS